MPRTAHLDVIFQVRSLTYYNLRLNIVLLYISMHQFRNQDSASKARKKSSRSWSDSKQCSACSISKPPLTHFRPRWEGFGDLRRMYLLQQRVSSRTEDFDGMPPWLGRRVRPCMWKLASFVAKLQRVLQSERLRSHQQRTLLEWTHEVQEAKNSRKSNSPDLTRNICWFWIGEMKSTLCWKCQALLRKKHI